MKFKQLVYLYILLFMTLAETLPTDEIVYNESCSAAKINEKLCGSYAFKIVKPLLDYFRQVQNKINNNENCIEGNNKVIRELQIEVAALQQKDSDHVQSIEVYKELVQSKAAHIKVLEYQNENLMTTLRQLNNTCQSSKKVSDQITKLSHTITDHFENIKEKEENILELKNQTNLDREKIQKCENQLKERDAFIVKNKNKLEEQNSTIAAHSKTIREQSNQEDILNSKISSEGLKTQVCENQLRETKLLAENVSNQVTELNGTVAANLETIKEKNSQLAKLQLQIESDGAKMQASKNQLENINNVIKKKNNLLANLETQKQETVKQLNKTNVKLEKCTKRSLEDKVNSCIPFANSPGIHNIKVPGLDPFDVLCGSAVTGPGWIVIQQRINGKEDFYRSFKSYRDGFGTFEGDFFLGLEKIHRLTSNQDYELYIHLESFNGDVEYATYNYFAVAGEEQQYELNINRALSGSTRHNGMKYHHRRKFYTFDRDNSNECARKHEGGWWYNECTSSNLNGKYFDSEVHSDASNFWQDYNSLKKVQMLIRPGEVGSCIPFAQSPGMHNIKVPGLDPFNVLCASSNTKPGWIVIQQRINGKENFYRDFNTYRDGFGSFEEDFFLGLEKIHRLTSKQRHELYIHMERYNEEIIFVNYDHFAIAGEDDQYNLISLGNFTGNTEENKMEYQKGQKFYTFDRDNLRKCASDYHGGWWYNECAACNLNGQYFKNASYGITSIYWHDKLSLKKVQMLIRPKFD